MCGDFVGARESGIGFPWHTEALAKEAADDCKASASLVIRSVGCDQDQEQDQEQEQEQEQE
jgi:hypothetical protein